jgi:hypothetical protein
MRHPVIWTTVIIAAGLLAGGAAAQWWNPFETECEEGARRGEGPGETALAKVERR